VCEKIEFKVHTLLCLPLPNTPLCQPILEVITIGVRERERRERERETERERERYENVP